MFKKLKISNTRQSNDKRTATPRSLNEPNTGSNGRPAPVHKTILLDKTQEPLSTQVRNDDTMVVLSVVLRNEHGNGRREEHCDTIRRFQGGNVVDLLLAVVQPRLSYPMQFCFVALNRDSLESSTCMEAGKCILQIYILPYNYAGCQLRLTLKAQRSNSMAHHRKRCSCSTPDILIQR
jgi:hypothetical protein